MEIAHAVVQEHNVALVKAREESLDEYQLLFIHPWLEHGKMT